MLSSRNVGLCLIAALMFCITLSSVLAAMNYVEGESPNGNAYAKAQGWYNTINNYYKEYHEGSVETAGGEAYTEFEGTLDFERVYYKIEYLDDYEGFYKTFFEYPDRIRTKTDSNTGDNGRIEVFIVPGLQP